ncbi:DUF6455 family protein [Jannaschia marina]|uniref:DUF6455 family protein n=1 Tax=Jannaschia marina TaxID=2741674 RepID=UPI0015C96E54|nr:DUF6455 family protein [Jannaschia marina]
MPDCLRPLGDVRRHLNLMRGMAAATGTDTEAAFAEGRLSHADWCEMLTRCRGCPSAESCKSWLAAPLPWPQPIPAACPNHDAFSALQMGQVTR